MQINSLSTNRRRRITGNTLIFLGGLMLMASAVTKLAQVPQIVTQLQSWGFAESKLTLVAILEISSALLFLLPPTRSLGLLLVSSYLGGAIATHLQHDQSPFVPAVFLSLLWLGAWLHPPETLWNLNRPALATSQRAYNKEQRESTLGKIGNKLGPPQQTPC